MCTQIVVSRFNKVKTNIYLVTLEKRSVKISFILLARLLIELYWLFKNKNKIKFILR